MTVKYKSFEKCLAFLIMLSACSSCQFKLLVSKDKLIYDRIGYLLIIQDNLFFLECDGPVEEENIFLDYNALYYLPQQVTEVGLDTLKYNSNYSRINIFYNGQIIQDTLFYSHYRIRADDYSFPVTMQDSLKISYQRKTYDLLFSNFGTTIRYFMPIYGNN